MAQAEIHSFDTEANRRFWRANRSPYQGASSAGPVIALVRPFLGSKILDAGAGDGSLVRALREALPRASVTGVDLAPKSAEIAEGDLTNLAFDAGAFDTVFCAEVIEHTESATTRDVLRELARVLAPGGHLVLTTPFDEDLAESTVHCPRCELDFHRWGHQQRFDERDFRALAQHAGLEVVELLPVRLNRLKSVHGLGSRVLRGPLRKFIAGRRGKRTLVMVARKPRSP